MMKGPYNPMSHVRSAFKADGEVSTAGSQASAQTPTSTALPTLKPPIAVNPEVVPKNLYRRQILDSHRITFGSLSAYEPRYFPEHSYARNRRFLFFSIRVRRFLIACSLHP